MDYEKKYKDALERARIWKDKSGMPKDKQGILDDIFPELKESKDERIRKEIISHFKETRCVTEEGAERIAKWISWIEKQGNKPKQTSIWKHWKDGIAGNGEGEPIYLVKNGNTYSLNSCLGFECDYIELSELDNLMLEKQGEQKPAEWSKEDEVGFGDAMWAIKQAMTIAKDENDMGNLWYAERWLKSIKERYTWKPSEIQLARLKEECDKYWEPDGLDTLYTLYQDLKKL